MSRCASTYQKCKDSGEYEGNHSESSILTAISGCREDIVKRSDSAYNTHANGVDPSSSRFQSEKFAVYKAFLEQICGVVRVSETRAAYFRTVLEKIFRFVGEVEQRIFEWSFTEEDQRKPSRLPLSSCSPAEASGLTGMVLNMLAEAAGRFPGESGAHFITALVATWSPPTNHPP
ncbi:hypothetical protein R3P38DRAFT_2767069 [Favolaschia claudopus]|uniref:Uncharacterized protein n=1 Tax=Favolaschia claudopus TaxID=2862362 RepID=A0AAW0CX51_9AGAR